jgi:F-type H+-transporting ATPase subunit epsilon
MTMIMPGEMIVRKENEDTYLAITGGFLEVRPEKVIVLADACERCEEIDLSRAEDARKRAQERLASQVPGADHTRAEAALRRSLARIKVAQRLTKRQNFPPRPSA